MSQRVCRTPLVRFNLQKDQQESNPAFQAHSAELNHRAEVQYLKFHFKLEGPQKKTPGPFFCPKISSPAKGDSQRDIKLDYYWQNFERQI